MNEASDGVRESTIDKQDGCQVALVENEADKTDSNLSENASRNQKMVENSATKLSSSSDQKVDKSKSDKGSTEKKYESRDRGSYRGVNGVKAVPSGRGRREDDRRSSPTKPFRRQDPKSSGTYRRDSNRELEPKKAFGKTILLTGNIAKQSYSIFDTLVTLLVLSGFPNYDDSKIWNS